MVVDSTHPDSTEQSKTTNREDFLTDLQKAINNINVNWCYGGSDRKRPRLESQSSEEEENDNIAFIKMANEIKEETEERFKTHVQKYQADGFTLKQAERGKKRWSCSQVIDKSCIKSI